jgi:hypothetical protein
MWLLGCQSVDHSNMHKMMKEQKNIVFFPAGAKEVAYYQYGKEYAYVGNKGYIKYALKYGYSVQPIYYLGETCLYYYNKPLWVKDYLLSSNGFKQLLALQTVIFSYGRSWLVPYQVRLKILYGYPIPFPKIDNPTQKDIDHWHDVYSRFLEDLVSKYREINIYK